MDLPATSGEAGLQTVPLDAAHASALRASGPATPHPGVRGRASHARWSSRFVSALCIGVILAVELLFFAPLTAGQTLADVALRQTTLYPWAVGGIGAAPTVHYDYTDSFYPWQVFINSALRSGEVPLWNPYSFGGQPFLANGQSGVLYPPRLILALTLPPERVHDVLLASHMLLGGITMLALLRGVRLSAPAAVFGALAWMTNSFMLTWMALEHFVVIEAWLPLAVLLIHRTTLASSVPSGIALSCVLALMFLGGNLLFVEITFAALAGYATFLLWTRLRRRIHPNGIVRVSHGALRGGLIVVAGFVAMFALIAPQLLPSVDLVRTMGRSPLVYEQFIASRLALGDLRYLFFELPQWLPQSTQDPYHRLLFLGTPTAYLAVLGLFTRHRLAAFSRWLAAFVLLVVLGTPLAWLPYTLLPGFAAFKPLPRALFLFDFALAVLAAFGLDSLLRLLPIGGKLAWSRSLARPAVTLVLAGISIAQLHHFGESVIHFGADTPDRLYPSTPALDSFANDDSTRILPVDPFFFGSIAMALHLQSAGGYDSLLPDRVTNLWRVVQGATPEQAVTEARAGAFQLRFSPDSLRFDLVPRLGITQVLAPPTAFYPQPAQGQSRPDAVFDRAPQLKLTYSGADGRVYTVESPVPREYLVFGCELASTPLAALKRVTDPAFDPRQSVVLEDGQPGVVTTACAALPSVPPATITGTVTLTSRTLNTLKVRIDAPREALLLVNETWDAGWRSWVDDHPSPVVLADYAFRAVQVPSGVHEVEFVYGPRSFSWGLWISCIALFAIAALGVVVSLKRRPIRPRVHCGRHYGHR